MKKKQKHNIYNNGEISTLSVRGAREHNLKNINVDIPRNKMTVITGLSGSGKSSLAFDTIYAEGQRRYVESLSAYARQFLELMQKPDVDSIDGLSPAISIEQKTTSKNPRSTVGTVTEIYDYMRLLWARVGIPYSPTTGLPIKAQTISQMVDRLMTKSIDSRIYILAPIVRGRKGEYKKEVLELRKKGFQRLRVDGTMYEIDEFPKLKKTFKHDIEVVVDRLVIKPGLEGRLAESLETSLNLADGIAYVDDADTEGKENRLVFSAKFACPVSGFTIDEIEPRLFSFNNPSGACSNCDGLGIEMKFDPNLIIPDTNKTIAEGAIAPWNNSKPITKFYLQSLYSLILTFNQSLDTPWKKLSKELKDSILNGTGSKEITVKYSNKRRSYEAKKPFEGVLNNIYRRWKETDSSWLREDLEKYQTVHQCSKCTGDRLKKEALAVKINNQHISEVTQLPVLDCKEWFLNLDTILSNKEKKIAKPILREINERLGFLVNVGLDYLTLSRNSGTLSGGESQRIRLASQIGSGLTGVLYVLDEPSIGLHQRDNKRLLDTLEHLRDVGNTVIIVEHDEEAIRSADHLIDMGVGAGIHGGEIVAEGTPETVIKNKNSLTAQYLNGDKLIPLPSERRTGNQKEIIIIGAEANNLKQINVTFPLAKLVCVTGVSGGGKSSLVLETLYKACAKTLNKARDIPGKYKEIKVPKVEDLEIFRSQLRKQVEGELGIETKKSTLNNFIKK